MKKLIIFILLLLCIYLIPKSFNSQIKIPDEAIRLRVIANSNSSKDQQLKMDVKDNLNQKLTSLLKNSQSIDTSRQILKNNLTTIENNVEQTLNNEQVNMPFNVNYGYNYFPQKEYKGVTYDEGNYESLVVTLGEGKGHNWWCVLFPPLCLLEGKENQTDETEYKFFIQEIIENFSK